MIRTLPLTVILLAIGLGLHGQTFTRSINWPLEQKQVNRKFEAESMQRVWVNRLEFDGAIYPDPISMIPHYTELIPLPNTISDISQLAVRVEYVGLELLSEDVLNSAARWDTGEMEIPHEKFDVFRSRGQSYLQATIPGVRFNRIAGQAHRVVRFNIVVEERHEVQSPTSMHSYAEHSALATGAWVRINVSKTGIHRITYSELEAMGLSNLSNVSVWGGGGKQLPFWNSQPSYDDLVQIPIWMDKGSDGMFNKGDYILFYAQGPVTWEIQPSDSMFTHSIHDYAERISYFITTDKANPLRIATIPNPSALHTRTSTSYDALVYFERNDTNLIKSGRQWFGDLFDVYTTRTYSTGLTKPVSGGKAMVRVNAAARSGSPSSFTVKANGNTLGTMGFSAVNLTYQYAYFAFPTEKSFVTLYNTGELTIELTYNKPSPAAKAWLDYIDINARQKLSMGDKQFDFRDLESVAPDQLTLFTLQNATNGLMVWDVTDLHQPANLAIDIQNGVAGFKRETEKLREFIAFYVNQAYGIEVVGDVPNQNIHGELQPDMVIVTHPNFLSQAEELAQIHLEDSGLKSLVVTSQQVYNEFSSGTPDVTAIRNMMRMFYSRATSEADMPRYLLLFGDGSYDNRTQSTSNTNYILTFQSENSLHVSSSFVSDDYLGLLDDNEGEASGLLDLGIGRIPANTVAEANVAVAKVRQYLHPSSRGSWHNQLCFIGDDEDYNSYMEQSDELANFVKNHFPRYNLEKIFFDAYPLVVSSQGASYPEVTKAINNRFNQGALIVNYIGHANPTWMSHEKVMMINDVQLWRNMDMLPLFITATCEFSRFDDYLHKSIGEHTLFSPKGGTIGLVSTSRVVYASPNYTLNKNFFNNVFAKKEGVEGTASDKYYRLGDVLRIAKTQSGSGNNKRNFLLLGDPALMLHYPDLDLTISEINGHAVGSVQDTLKAMGRVEIKGSVAGNRDYSDFDGEATITLYDKEREVTTLSNTGLEPFVFKTRSNTIYKGRATVSNGEFRASFMVPKDIMYNYGSGRFSLYAQNDLFTGSGFFENFVVGGLNDSIGTDTSGPGIEIYMNDKNFVSGGIVDDNPKLIIHLADSSGINTTGTGIGHDLEATLMGKTKTTLVLNDYYIADVDSYQSGRVEYQLSNLSPGDYDLRVKAWDVYNNSNESEVSFTVKSEDRPVLSHVLNYPNPFTESTAFYFEHNQPFEDFDVSIQIYSPSGKLVKTIEYQYPGSGSYRIGPIYWDGLDDFGDRIGRGVYFYRVRVKLSNGKTAQAQQKLVILK
ncbi:MAG TPA: type IX secretion system sortase PorU [Tenuifilaceae bacterium]|nr:type IX secretion system sortase PorU [Tenuifilaceae bacterium]